MLATRRAVLGGLQQVRQRGVGRVEQALGVDGDHAVPLVGVGADDRPEEHQAGVVGEGVGPSEALDGLRHGRLGLGPSGDVGLDDQGGAARGVDLGGQGLQAVPATGDEGDRRAVLGEVAGGGGRRVGGRTARVRERGGGVAVRRVRAVSRLGCGG
jgi:hypothetical protein